MRVLMLNHEFPPLGGGAGRVCFEIARRLVGDGHGVTVVTTGGCGTSRYECLAGIPVHRVYGRRRSPLDNHVPVTMASYLLAGARKAKSLFEKQPFDLIHAYFTVPAGWVGLWLKSQTGVPLVVSPHGSDVPHHNPGEWHFPIRMLTPLIARTWRQADRLVTVSEGLRETVRRTVPHIACDVIHNGIDLNHFTPCNTAPQNPVPQLICVGRLVQLKGIQNLLSALARLKKSGVAFRLQIAGEGNYRTELEQQCAREGLNASVQFLGRVPYETLPAFYRASDIFVLPSMAEAFGQTFAEAMACGLPVVGTTAGGIPEVTGPHQRPWLVEPGNVDALAERLATLLAAPALQRKLCRQNVAYVRQHFGWDRIGKAYAGLYADLLHRPLSLSLSTPILNPGIAEKPVSLS